MLLKDRWISDRMMLKLVAKILRKPPAAKGYKITTERGVEKVTYEEIIQFIEDLAEAVYSGDYVEVNRCKTCGNFSPEYCGRGRGWCPKFADYKTSRDFCSAWIPQTEQQKEIIRRVYGGFKQLQTQRAGNGSKDSNKGNRPTAGGKAKRRSDS